MIHLIHEIEGILASDAYRLFSQEMEKLKARNASVALDISADNKRRDAACGAHLAISEVEKFLPEKLEALKRELKRKSKL